MEASDAESAGDDVGFGARLASGLSVLGPFFIPLALDMPLKTFEMLGRWPELELTLH